ncbi:MAG: mechanosensitive ion channel family protein [Gammaproteobacteria bacterium]
MLEPLVLFMKDTLTMVGDNKYLQAGAAVVMAVALAKVIDIAVTVAARWAKKTRTAVDDLLLEGLHRPLFMTVILIGLGVATLIMEMQPAAQFTTVGILRSILLLVWIRFAIRLARGLCRLEAERPDTNRFVQPATLPLFDNLILLGLLGLGAYLLLQIWEIHIGAWVASAGVVGLAISFAAKDSLANLFAGVFIIADAPYRVGDYVVLDSGDRGRVTHIGLRSTRLLTRDDIEVTIPNSVMGNSSIVNQTGGPRRSYRTKIPMTVCYGEDLEKVRDVLMAIVTEIPGVSKQPEPRVRFRRFDDSGIALDLLCWVNRPALRGQVTDQLIMAIHARFAEEEITFPYPRQELYLQPSADSE